MSNENTTNKVEGYKVPVINDVVTFDDANRKLKFINTNNKANDVAYTDICDVSFDDRYVDGTDAKYLVNLTIELVTNSGYVYNRDIDIPENCRVNSREGVKLLSLARNIVTLISTKEISEEEIKKEAEEQRQKEQEIQDAYGTYVGTQVDPNNNYSMTNVENNEIQNSNNGYVITHPFADFVEKILYRDFFINIFNLSFLFIFVGCACGFLNMLYSNSVSITSYYGYASLWTVTLNLNGLFDGFLASKILMITMLACVGLFIIYVFIFDFVYKNKFMNALIKNHVTLVLSLLAGLSLIASSIVNIVLSNLNASISLGIGGILSSIFFISAACVIIFFGAILDTKAYAFETIVEDKPIKPKKEKVKKQKNVQEAVVTPVTNNEEDTTKTEEVHDQNPQDAMKEDK